MQVEAAPPGNQIPPPGNQVKADALQSLDQQIVVQNIRGNERRDRIKALITQINGKEFRGQIRNIAALRKLTSFELKNIRFRHGGIDYLVTGGTWCNVYQTDQRTRTILLRLGCRPQAYLDSITTCMVDAMQIRIYCSLEDLSLSHKDTRSPKLQIFSRAKKNDYSHRPSDGEHVYGI
jgi:hypothetical protein